MKWLKDFQYFISDMYRLWVGKLTASLSILLAITPLIFPDYFSGSRGLIHTQWAWWAASAVAFFIASRLAWDEQRTKRIEAEQQLEDNRPKLAIDTNSVEGPKTWMEHSVPVTFSIQHISGRVPTSIRFDPVLSKLGKFSLRFGALPYATRPPHPTGMSFEVVEIGAPQLSARDLERTRDTQKQLLDLFLHDSPKGLALLEYPLVCNFLDGDVQCRQTFCLRFEMDRIRFSTDTSHCS